MLTFKSFIMINRVDNQNINSKNYLLIIDLLFVNLFQLNMRNDQIARQPRIPSMKRQFRH